MAGERIYFDDDLVIMAEAIKFEFYSMENLSGSKPMVYFRKIWLKYLPKPIVVCAYEMKELIFKTVDIQKTGKDPYITRGGDL